MKNHIKSEKNLLLYTRWLLQKKFIVFRNKMTRKSKTPHLQPLCWGMQTSFFLLSNTRVSKEAINTCARASPLNKTYLKLSSIWRKIYFRIYRWIVHSVNLERYIERVSELLGKRRAVACVKKRFSPFFLLQSVHSKRYFTRNEAA